MSWQPGEIGMIITTEYAGTVPVAKYVYGAYGENCMGRTGEYGTWISNKMWGKGGQH
jgi:hypothetical protein